MTEQRMSAAITKLAKRRGRLPAFVAALGLAGLLVAQRLLSGLISWLEITGLIAMQGHDASLETGLAGLTVGAFDPSLSDLSFFVLPFALGVYISLWLFAPVSHELDLRFVLTRAGLAAAAGSLVYLVVGLVLALLGWLGIDEGVFQSFGLTGDTPALVQGLFRAITGAVQTFISLTPAVMFVVVLLWIWLRDHPREYEVSGLIDEV